MQDYNKILFIFLLFLIILTSFYSGMRYEKDNARSRREQIPIYEESNQYKEKINSYVPPEYFKHITRNANLKDKFKG